MKIVCTGRGTSGSWQVRGLQLGHAIGAEAMPDCRNLEPYDLAILVKRTTGDLVPRLHRAGLPIVFDVVDSWPQPVGNEWDRAHCMAWLTQAVEMIKPVGIVAATAQMQLDCAEFGVPVLFLPHHARPGLRRNPIRREVETVAYEGGEAYLGKWRRVLEMECKSRGWRFVVNPSHLADIDVVVALREATGYGPRNWKSGVKLSNAHGSGTPFIGSREAGYLETACGAEYFADTPVELSAALDAMVSQKARRALADHLFKARRTLEQTAKEYRRWLEGIAR